MNINLANTQSINQIQNLDTVATGNDANDANKVGDEFEIVNRRFLQRENGTSHPFLTVDHSKILKVIEVNSQSAVLTSHSLGVINNSQLHNLVSPKSIF